MPARINAPHEASAPLYPDLPPHLGAFRSPAKVHTKLRQNAYKSRMLFYYLFCINNLQLYHREVSAFSHVPPHCICRYTDLARRNQGQSHISDDRMLSPLPRGEVRVTDKRKACGCRPASAAFLRYCICADPKLNKTV